MNDILVRKVTISASLRKIHFPKISEQAGTFNNGNESEKDINTFNACRKKYDEKFS